MARVLRDRRFGSLPEGQASEDANFTRGTNPLGKWEVHCEQPSLDSGAGILRASTWYLPVQLSLLCSN